MNLRGFYREFEIAVYTKQDRPMLILLGQVRADALYLYSKQIAFACVKCARVSIVVTGRDVDAVLHEVLVSVLNTLADAN
jgi:hypothetical protein